MRHAGMLKHRLIALLCILLVCLLSGAGALAEDPETMTFGDYADYDLPTLLSNYNIIAFGNVTLTKHCLGGVIVQGKFHQDLDGVAFADGTVFLPSYLHGNYENTTYSGHGLYHDAKNGTR